MHGNGNDFIVIDHRSLQDTSLPWNEISRRICDRHFGIGADQVLLIERPPKNTPEVCATMVIFDADGSQVEMCGNGLRAVALYLQQEKIDQANKLKIATLERIVSVEQISDKRFQVDMGKPILEGRKIPVNHDGKIINYPITVSGKSYSITGVSMGNPHAVIYLEKGRSVNDYPVTFEGPAIENDSFFPNRVNIEFVEVLSDRKVRARVWERGTGETLACGSGACAIVVAGVLTKQTHRKILIQLPGGNLDLEWRKADDHVLLTGEAKRVFDGDIDLRDFA